jgi:steroid 5-alpha reductase family enzyme
MDYLNLILTSLALVLACVMILWLISISLRDVSIIDMFFAMILACVALLGGIYGNGSPQRKYLVIGLVLIWAARISYHVIRRNWGHGEDPRYTVLRRWVPEGWAFHMLSLKQVFLLQGVVIWILSLPMLWALSFPAPRDLGPIAWAGTSVFLLGLFFEVVGDQQLKRFRHNPANRGKILDSGLWRYSRHPNYFGELCIWWGIFLIACEHPWGLATVIGPAVYSYLVVNVTGKRPLEKQMLKRPGYREYMDRTSGLIPLPPRKQAR